MKIIIMCSRDCDYMNCRGNMKNEHIENPQKLEVQLKNYDNCSRFQKNNIELMNEKRFNHLCGNSEFLADRCDFKNGITVNVDKDITDEQLASDVAGMIGYHAINIHKQLNGFAGYDCIQWNIVRDEYPLLKN